MRSLPRHLLNTILIMEKLYSYKLFQYLPLREDSEEKSRRGHERVYIYIYTMVWVQIPSREEQKFDSSKI